MFFAKFKVPENLPRQSLRSSTVIFEYEAPRTHAWDAFFTNLGKQLANRLSITEFDLSRLKELNESISPLSSLNLKPGKQTWS